MEFLEILDGELKDNPSGALKKEDIFDKLIEAYGSPDWLGVKKILTKHRCTNHIVKEIKRELHKKANVTDISPEEEPPKLISDTIKDSPVHGLASCPHGWAIRDFIPGINGALRKMVVKSDPLFGYSATGISVCAVPILITERLESIHDGIVHLKISFKYKNSWVDVVAPQSHVFNSQTIIGCLGDRGLPITSNTKGDIIDYLCAYLSTNDEYIPTTYVSNKMGWVGDKESSTTYGFLCGENFLCNQVKLPQHKRKIVRFLGISPGDTAEAKTISTGGSYAEWLKTIEGINAYPRAEIGIYAALSSVLLEPLNAPGYIIDWSYRTGRGKTTILNVAASVWGRGDKLASDSPIKAWTGTKVGIEMSAAVLNSLPLILDDTKDHRKYGGESIIPSVIYSVFNSRGCIRGTKSGGSEIVRSWRTVLLSNGEQSITNFDKSEGTATRTLCISGLPFNGTGEREYEFISKLDNGLCEHYGHAGLIFAKWVIRQKPNWKNWKKTLDLITEGYRMKLSKEHDYGISGRLAKSLGMLELTARLAHEALNLPWKYKSPVSTSIFDDISHGADQADQASEALRDIFGWCYSNKHRFEDSHDYDPKYTTLGKWDVGSTQDDWDKIFIISKDLCNELKKLGHEPMAILKAWKHAGITECEDRRTTKRVRLNSAQVHCVCINRSTLENTIPTI